MYRNLALHLHISNLYHFFTQWTSEESLIAFKISCEFELLKGAFKALGCHVDVMSGRWADIQLLR